MAENSLSPSAVEPVLAQSRKDDASTTAMMLMSSPPRMAAPTFVDVEVGGKERRQPSITPRKFRRFFTPRSRVSADPSAARRALRDLTARALNRNQTPSSSPLPISFNSSPLAARDKSNRCPEALPSPRTTKRRKTGHQTPETSPLRPASIFHGAVTPEPVSKADMASMLLSPLASSPLPAIVDEPESYEEEDELAMSDDEPELPFSGPSFKRTITLAEQSFSGQLLQRETGTMPRTGNMRVAQPVAGMSRQTVQYIRTYSANISFRLESRDIRLLQLSRRSPLLL